MHIPLISTENPLWSASLSLVRHDFYLRPEYVALEAKRQGAQARGFIYREDDRFFLIPLLIRTVNDLFDELHRSEPIYDAVSPYGYPGIALSESARRSPDFIARAIDSMNDSLRGAGVCSAFLRMNPLLCDGYAALFPEGYFTHTGETVAVDLTLDEETLRRQIRSNHRTNLNKLQRLGFVPRWVRLSEHLDAFRSIYTETMIRVDAKQEYHFDAEYFNRLAEMPDRVHCCLVEIEKEIAAGCIFFETDGIVQAHLAGTRNAWLPHSPFLQVLYSAIGWGKERGNRYLHLGGGLGGANDRLFQYKAGFSPLRFDFFTMNLVLNPAIYQRLARLRFPDATASSESMAKTGFFPIYRAVPSHNH